MNYHFSASRISGDGNKMFPDEIIIDESGVTYRKPRVIGCKEMKVKYSAIGSVSLDKHLLFADVVIETNGGRTIYAKGFTRNDAAQIQELIESML